MRTRATDPRTLRLLHRLPWMPSRATDASDGSDPGHRSPRTVGRCDVLERRSAERNSRERFGASSGADAGVRSIRLIRSIRGLPWSGHDDRANAMAPTACRSQSTGEDAGDRPRTPPRSCTASHERRAEPRMRRMDRMPGIAARGPLDVATFFEPRSADRNSGGRFGASSGADAGVCSIRLIRSIRGLPRSGHDDRANAMAPTACRLQWTGGGRSCGSPSAFIRVHLRLLTSAPIQRRSARTAAPPA